MKGIKIPDPVKAPSVPSFEYEDIQKGDKIGAGGDADVYEATLTVEDKTYRVALKEPRFQETLQTDIIQRYEAEAETWANLDDHQNIVSVYGHGSSSIPWIALEFMPC